MLITIVHSINHGKVVLHKYPYEKIQLEQEGLDRLPTNEVLQILAEHFDYFGVFHTKNLVQTSTHPLPQKAVVEMFMANQKFSQVTLGIDDQCVLVTRSSFLETRNCSPSAEVERVGQSVMMLDIPESTKSQILSITLIWRQSSFEKVEETKHRLSFLLSILERKEQHSQFLTKQLVRIMDERQKLERKIRDIFTTNSREGSNTFQEVRMKIIVREIQNTAKGIREQFELFNLLRKYYESWTKGETFEMREHQHYWEGTIGGTYCIQEPPQDFRQKIQHKALVMLPTKMSGLPQVLYSDRVRNLYERGLSLNQMSLKRLLERNKDIQPRQLFHTTYFLLRNNLAVDVYPIDPPQSYNLFYLRDLPSKLLIEKFNSKIFPGENCLDILSQYSKYKLVQLQPESMKFLKYLLLKGVVREVGIYIYRKYGRGEDSTQQMDHLLYSTIQKYNMGDQDLNFMLATQPYGQANGQLLNKVFKFIKSNSKDWGFYFVERS